MRTMEKVRAMIWASKAKSAWDKGVKVYALELLDELDENYTPDDLCNKNLLLKAMLNGADGWLQYSEGGCSLVYDTEIAERLCNKTELKRVKGGEKPPNAMEGWIELQAWALLEAGRLIIGYHNNHPLTKQEV